ncbi:hypothetical protein RP20_CCG008773 [Aedes albopictus]|nr:hypothetical protein RP20_CCG008773 [Aedes albopictus]
MTPAESDIIRIFLEKVQFAHLKPIEPHRTGKHRLLEFSSPRLTQPRSRSEFDTLQPLQFHREFYTRNPSQPRA